MDAPFVEEGKRFLPKLLCGQENCRCWQVLTALPSDAGTSILVAGVGDLSQIGGGEPEMFADEGAGDQSLASFAA
ncbi:hypothetical protein H4W33_007206 [Kibdelosporangium phytohabitans]|nr:hypothetical protein [Kibdelosporangium phytohabitans]MBE1468194.1 hypothetical protein [Kibdelosporangium phytohabitans]